MTAELLIANLGQGGGPMRVLLAIAIGGGLVYLASGRSGGE
jgi:hypothetical protein